jgi:hypothetical protein
LYPVAGAHALVKRIEEAGRGAGNLGAKAMFTDLNRVMNARNGALVSGHGDTNPVIRRETVAAWLVGAGVWLAGLGFLAMQSAPGAYASTMEAETGAPAYYELSSANTYVQDVAGRYTIVVRTFRPVNCG